MRQKIAFYGLLSAVCLMFSIQIGSTQNLTRYEYWFDNKVDVSVKRTLSASTSVVNIADSADISALPLGLHTLTCRFGTATNWTATSSNLFYRLDSRTGTNAYCEYWFDNQAHITRTLNSDQNGIVIDSIDAQTLSIGLHTLNMRVGGSNGFSSIISNLFYRLPSNSNSVISSYEYWFDNDRTNRTAKNVTQMTQNNILMDSIDVRNVSNGIHQLNIRLGGLNGWTSGMTHLFYKLDNTNGISGIEYWVNHDYTNRKFKQMDFGTEGVILDSLNVSDVCRDVYTLHTRFRTPIGWSAIKTDSFSKNAYSATEALSNFVFHISDLGDYKVSFTDSSKNYTHFKWSFGDGNTDTLRVNPTYRYALPGIYQVCLKVNNRTIQGNCGEDSICKTVAVKGISGILPNRAANTGLCIATITGYGFTLNSKVQLVQNNQIISIDSSFFINNSELRVQIKFRNAAQGIYKLRVITGIDTLNLLNAFTVEAAPLGYVFHADIKIIGPSSILVGREFDYQIAITNKGNTAAFAIPVYVTIPKDKIGRVLNSMDSTGIVRGVLDSISEPSRFHALKDSISNDTSNFAALILPYIMPYGTEYLNLKIKSLTNTPVKIEVHIGQSLIDSVAGKRIGTFLVSPISSVPENTCVELAGGSPCAASLTGLGLDVVSKLGAVGAIVGFAAGIADIACQSVKMATQEKNGAKDWIDGVDKLGTTIVAERDLVNTGFGTKKHIESTGGLIFKNLVGKLHFGVSTYSIGNDCFGKDKDKTTNPATPIVNKEVSPEITVVASRDPNLKEGPKGINALNAVNGKGLLPYTIYYENADSATAPASEVRVIDTLDATKFDLSSFFFTGFGFSSSNYYLDGNKKTFVREVDMRPRKNIILRITGDLDSTGVITWSFTSLDPRNMDLTQDITQGFLPPNRTKPEGEGYVSYMVRLKSDLPHATTVKNKASIVFDVNEPILTPIWINTVDKVAPTSRVISSKTTPKDSVLSIRWSGTDAQAGIMDYTIYVSENGGVFTPWLYNVSSDSALFTGKIGRKYAFYSTARDYVGNVESKSPIAEINTGSVATADNFIDKTWLGQNKPNPFSNTTTIDFYLDRPSAYVELSLFDIAGKRINVIKNERVNSGLNTITLNLNNLQSGIYIYQLQTSDGIRLTKRMVVQR